MSDSVTQPRCPTQELRGGTCLRAGLGTARHRGGRRQAAASADPAGIRLWSQGLAE